MSSKLQQPNCTGEYTWFQTTAIAITTATFAITSFFAFLRNLSKAITYATTMVGRFNTIFFPHRNCGWEWMSVITSSTYFGFFCLCSALLRSAHSNVVQQHKRCASNQTNSIDSFRHTLDVLVWYHAADLLCNSILFNSCVEREQCPVWWTHSKRIRTYRFCSRERRCRVCRQSTVYRMTSTHNGSNRLGRRMWCFAFPSCVHLKSNLMNNE